MTAGPDLLRVHIAGHSLQLEVSLYVLGALVLLFGLLPFLAWNKRSIFHKYKVVRLNVQLGNVGTVELQPNNEDVQIAHRIWTELVTRKAAQPIDVEHDVITEIYDSWYALFGRIRQLIADIPGHMIRNEKSTQELVRIATQTLNNGLRPHLTRWQARFRHWYENCPEAEKAKCPQDCEKAFPDYALLVEDMKKVNSQLIQYAGELEKIILGPTKS